MELCEEALSAQDIGTALYGLKRMKITPALDGLLLVLTEKVQQCTESFSPQEASAAFNGLKQLGSSPAMEGLLSALSEKVDLSKKEKEEQQESTITQQTGLQVMAEGN